MTDLFKSIGDGFNKLGRACDDQMKKIGERTNKNVTEDFDRVANKTKNENFFSGAIQALDELSVGNMTADTAQNLGLIGENDNKTKELVSAGVNLTTGLVLASATGMPVFALGGVASASKDLVDYFQASPAAPGAPMAQPQSTLSPKEQLRRAKAEQCGGHVDQVNSAKKDALKAAKAEAKAEARAEAKERAIELAKAKAEGRRSGYAEGFEAGRDAGAGSAAGGVRNVVIDVHYCNEMLECSEEHFGKDKTDQVTDKIDDILNNPNLCFEDMIFALLRAIMKDSQDQAKSMANDLRGQRAEERGARKDWDDKIAKKQDEIKNEKDPSKKNDLQNDLQSLREQRAGDLGDMADSRNQIAEDLKNLMQKLSEMQQAMSNVLNSQHESAMAAIRNIR